jgi:hypothetical protein
LEIQDIVICNVVLAGCCPDYIPMLMVFVSMAIMQDLRFESDEIRYILQDALGRVLAMHQGSKVELGFDFP